MPCIQLTSTSHGSGCWWNLSTWSTICSGLLRVHEDVARAWVPFRVYRPLRIKVVEAHGDNPVDVGREDRLLLRVHDTHDDGVGGDAVVPRPPQHGCVAQAGDGRDHAIL